MTSWQEIERIRKDVKAARALAKRLLDAPEEGTELTDWESMFLESIAAWTRGLTTRQAEKLLQVRDNAERVKEVYEGFNVETLLQRCYEARLDLKEADEAWIVDRRERSRTTIFRRDAARLMRCARELELIDHYVG